MGMRSRFSLMVIPRRLDFIVRRELNDHSVIFLEDNPGGLTSKEWKWPTWRQDCKRVSEEVPEARIILYVESEDYDETHVQIWKNGRTMSNRWDGTIA